MREHPNPRPRDDTDAVKDIARELADLAHQISTLKGEANAHLGGLDYDTLRLRLENHPGSHLNVSASGRVWPRSTTSECDGLRSAAAIAHA